jgi:hypothetical protein
MMPDGETRYLATRARIDLEHSMIELKQNKNIERALPSLAKVEQTLKEIEAKNQPETREVDEDDTEYDRDLA